MKYKKGFTLIEIIGAIVILGIILIIAFTTYTSSLKGARDNYYNSLKRTLAKSGEEFFVDNRIYRPNGILLAQEVRAETLMSKGYISSIVDYNGDSCDNSYVIVIKEGKDNYSYHACLICAADDYNSTTEDTYCDRSWLDPTKVELGIGEMDDLFVYKGTTKNDLKKQLEVPVSYIRKNNNNEIIAEIKGIGEGEPIILPNNIDVVNTNIVTSEDNPYIVNYEYKDQIGTRKVFVYENSEPTISYKKEQKVLKNLSGESVTKNEEDYDSGTWAQNVIVYLNSKEYKLGNKTIEGLGTSRFQWNKDGRWQDFCTTDPCRVKVTEEMNQQVQFRIIDTNGNISKVTDPIIMRIDNTKPNCGELTIPTTIGEHEWYKSDVVVNITGKEEKLKIDNESLKSGIEFYNIQKSTDDIDKTKTIDSITHDKDTSSVTYVGFVIDKAENFDVCKSVTFKKDSTAPKCTQSGGSTTWVNTSRTITWGCNDPLNENVRSNCNPDYSGSSKEYSNTLKTTEIEAYTIKDMAGNTVNCPKQNANIYVDKTNPKCTNSGDSTTWTHDDRTIYWGCSDDDSKCDPKLSGGSKVFNITTKTSIIEAYIIKDIAGNQIECPKREANVYVSKEVKCEAGKYLPKNTQKCETCLANNYCPGGTYTTFQDKDQGITACKTGYTCGTGKSSKKSCCKTVKEECCKDGIPYNGGCWATKSESGDGPTCESDWRCTKGFVGPSNENPENHCLPGNIAMAETGWCVNSCDCRRPVPMSKCDVTVCQQ